MMLLAKSARVPKPASPKKKQQGRDLRIPSNGSAMSGMSEVSAAHKASQALTKIRPPMARMNPAAERRIMSLSEINNNVPTGAHAYKSKVPSLISSNSGVSRSHSVKSNFTGKPSWKTDKRIQSLGPFNKENEISEDSEGELDAERDDAATIDGADRELDEFSSDAGTERRGSHLSQTNSEMTYDDRNSYVERSNPARDNGSRFSFDPSEYTYGTGSYMTGSEVDRRDSLESTIDGTIGVASTHEGDEEEEAVGGAEQHEPEDLDHTVSDIPADDDMLELEAPPSMEQLAAKKGGEYAPPSDSGLGTDLPTVEAEGSRNGEYFD